MTVAIILGILVILIFIICGVLAYQKMNLAEGFDLGANTELSTCPLQSKAYLARNGDTLCCENSLGPEGDCSKPLCALAKRNDIPSCKAMLDEANKKAAKICPPSLPNYYTDGKATTGCTDGALNNERTGPISASSKICKVYPDKPVKINGKPSSYTLNDTNMDSCSVQRRFEIDRKDMKELFGSNFIDVITMGQKGEQLLSLISYKMPGSSKTLQNGTCYSKDTLLFMFNNMPTDGQFFTTEAGRKAYIELIKKDLSGFECSVQNALYIKKSMTSDEFSNKNSEFQKSHPDLYK